MVTDDMWEPCTAGLVHGGCSILHAFFFINICCSASISPPHPQGWYTTRYAMQLPVCEGDDYDSDDENVVELRHKLKTSFAHVGLQVCLSLPPPKGLQEREGCEREGQGGD